MAGYTKNIAVIKGVKSGFSSDGGALSGLIKTEKYNSYFRAEVTLINFAPLTEGRYVIAISDGANEEVFGTKGFEGESEVDISYGYAAAVCFVLKDEVKLIATAICGDYAYAVDFAERAVEVSENIASYNEAAYNDEAIAEENYYEKGEECIGDEGGNSLCEDKKEEKEQPCGTKNENNGGVCKEPQKEKCEKPEYKTNLKQDNDIAKTIPLAKDTGFYQRVKGEIDRILSTYPREHFLEDIIEGSRWAKIDYGKGKYYVFGLIYSGNKPGYICYGVPSENAGSPPESLKGMASYIPAGKSGYWVMYQDAGTGISVRIDSL